MRGKIMDWTKIRNEYITTNTSYRKLAAKHNVSLGTLFNIAKSEKWVELRKQHYDKTITKTLEKSSEIEANRQVKLLDTFEDGKQKLITKWNEFFNKVEDVKELRALSQIAIDIKALTETKENTSSDKLDKLDQLIMDIKDMVD